MRSSTVPMLLALALAGCEDPPGDGYLLVIVTSAELSGTRLADVSAIEATASRIDVVHREDCADAGSETVITVVEEPVEVSFMSEGPNVGRFVSQFPVPPGCVMQVRFITSDARLQRSGRSFEIRVPSGAQTGIKVIPADDEGPFPIVANETTAIAIDYDANRELRVNRPHGFIHRPVLRAVRVEPTAAIGAVLDRLVVTFDPATPNEAIDEVVAACGGNIVSRFPAHLLVLQLENIGLLQESLECFNASGHVVSALPDMLMEPEGPNPFIGTPNDPLYTDADAVEQTIFESVTAPAAWEVTTGDRSVVVSVVDTGFELMHVDLIPNLRINAGEIPEGVDVVDADSDGNITFFDLKAPENAAICASVAGNYPPDTSCDPLDLVNGDCQPTAVPSADCAAGYGWQDSEDNDGNGFEDDLIGWDFDGPDNLPEPGFFPDHGTIMSGIVTAVGNNRSTSLGMMWRSALVPVRATYFTLPSGAVTDRLLRSSVLQGLEYAHESGARAINLSLGTIITQDGSPGNVSCAFSGDVSTDSGVRSVPSDKFVPGVRALADEWEMTVGRHQADAVLVVAGHNCNADISHDYPGTFVYPAGFVTARRDLGIDFVHSTMITTSAVRVHDRATGDPVPPTFIGVSAFGPNTILIAAPGTGFTGLADGEFLGLARDTTHCGWRTGSPFDYCGGNSASAAMVTGAVGLVMANNPSLTPLEARSRILDSAFRLLQLEPGGTGASIGIQEGRFLNVRRAVGP